MTEAASPADARINGCRLRHSLTGDGVPVVLTPGGRLGMDALRSTAAAFGEGIRLLQWDRCNTGASDVWVDDPSEQIRWADDLAALVRALELAPAYLAGGSAGARVSYLAAIRHPDVVRGLVLWSVSGGPYACQLLGYNYHTPFIEAAIRGGMDAVAETVHFRELIAANPTNRDRLLAMDVDHFVAVMRRWNAFFYFRDAQPVIGATAEELRQIECPTLVFDGNDDYHPTEPARALHALVPASTFVPCAWTRDDWMWRYVGRVPESVVELYPRMVPTILEYIADAERAAG